MIKIQVGIQYSVEGLQSSSSKLVAGGLGGKATR